MSKGRKKYAGLMDRLKGDKVVWIVALMLILISIVCIFSSSSRLLKGDQTRLDIVWSQVKTVLAGLLVIFVCYEIRSEAVFKFVARLGFIFSFLLIMFMIFGPTSGPVRSITLNGARRAVSVLGKQIFVYEIVKVAMVMYLSWAVDAFKKKKFERFVPGREVLQKFIFIYLPFLVITVLMVDGSGSAALFVGGIMILTILIGLSDIRDVAVMVLLGIMGFGLSYGVFEISDHKLFSRYETIFSRANSSLEESIKEYHLAGTKKEKDKIIDRIRQPYSALMAIKEGGVIGKGPGQSTQRYVVPDMSEDYMYSFIVEEYGFFGGLFVIALYLSLLARGTLIVKNCNDLFQKTAVAGLTLLIVLQAFLHICVNLNVGPVTGQTLPLISHGKSAFLCFCFAFGILLSFSRSAQEKIEREEKAAASLVDQDGEDNISSSINELDSYDL
ncbi:MAG: FtsW/RodA/SpoVE family cell cycle protein [Bacteroidales bacterium]|nr:FtsW/RodA/SpoVE family cell cycle protein [Bacteroidales bacterium]